MAAAPSLRHAPSLPGHTLTASSTTASLGAIGMTITGEPAFGRADQSRHNLVSGGSKDPNYDAVIRIGSECHSGTLPLLHCAAIISSTILSFLRSETLRRISRNCFVSASIDARQGGGD